MTLRYYRKLFPSAVSSLLFFLSLNSHVLAMRDDVDYDLYEESQNQIYTQAWENAKLRKKRMKELEKELEKEREKPGDIPSEYSDEEPFTFRYWELSKELNYLREQEFEIDEHFGGVNPPTSDDETEIKEEIGITHNPTTPRKKNLASYETTGVIKLENLKTKEDEEIEESQIMFSTSIDSAEFTTPTKQPTNPLLGSLSDPSHDKLSQKEIPVLLKPSIQWIGHRDFTLIDEKTKHHYKPSDSHFALRQTVDDNVEHFPGSENLFALQLTFLIESENNRGNYQLIPHNFHIKGNDNKTRKLLFVSATESKSTPSHFILSGQHIENSKKKEWFNNIYGKSEKEIHKSAQSYYHSEQWAMLWLFENIEASLGFFYEACTKHKPFIIQGLFLDGHTWNDPCEICQEMFHQKLPQFKNKVENWLKEKGVLGQNFFVLPILSSQDWYASKRLRPLDIQDSGSLRCDKRTTKGTVNDEDKSKNSKTCNRFFQYTVDYKTRLENQNPLRPLGIQTDFVSKRSFPCFWLYKEGEVQETLANKVYNTFSQAESFQGKIGKNNGSYVIFNHPALKIWKDWPLYPFPQTTLELAQFKTLTSLSIKSQFLGDSGAEELSKAFPSLTTLTSLDLSQNNFGSHTKMSIVNINTKEKKSLCSGFPSLLKSLSSLNNLTYLKLSKNILNKEAAQLLSWSLPSLAHLKKMDLQGTSLTYDSADNILTVAHNVPSITDIDFSENKIFHHCNDNGSAQKAATILLGKTIRIHVNNGKFAKPITLNLDDNTLEGIQF